MKRITRLILKPIILLMDRLSYVKKFLIIGVIVGIFIVSIGISRYFEIDKKIVDLQNAQTGAIYINEIKGVLKDMQVHRGIGYTFGEAAIDEQDFLNRQALIKEGFQKLKQSTEEQEQLLLISKDIQKVETEWLALQEKSSKISADEWFLSYTIIVNEVLDLYNHVSYHSGLMLDTDRNRHYFTMIVTEDVPRLVEALEQMRIYGTKLSIKESLDDVERHRLLMQYRNARNSLEKIKKTFATLVLETSHYNDSKFFFEEYVYREKQSLLNTINDDGPDDQLVILSSTEFSENIARMVNLNCELNQLISAVLIDDLEKERNKLQWSKWRVLGGTLLIGFIGLYIYLGSYYSVYRAISTLKRETAKIADGDFTTRVTLNTKDELSLIAVAINKMAQSLEIYVANRTVIEEELIESKDKAVQASKAKSVFLANISHEIRTPMNIILGMTGLVLKSDLNKEQREYITMVRESSISLLHIINDVLDFSKIESGKMTLKYASFDLRKLFNKIIKFQSLKADEKGIALLCTVDDGVPTYVGGDPLQIQQIITNLIGNAIKFTDIGQVELQVENVQEDEETVYIKCSVHDTGIGIPKEKLNLLFQSFSQVDNSLSRTYEGTGLGLAISKKLTELMDGTIGVESEFKKGSTFFFTIPLQKTEESEVYFDDLHNLVLIEGMDNISEENNKSNLQAANLLLVEDKKMNRKLAVALLERRGYTVQIAENGKEAVDKVVEENFDVVLMDISMPIMDGIEATKQIRHLESKYNRRRLPIIAMTANALKGDRDKYIAAGMDDYVSKPINTRELYSAIEAFLPEQREKTDLVKEVNGDRNQTPIEKKSIEGLEKIKEQLGDDKEIIAEIIAVFLEDCPNDLAELQLAIDHSDRERLKIAAHGLKGELGNLGIKQAYQFAVQLDKLAKKESFNKEEAQNLLNELQQEVEKLEQFFNLENWFERL